MVGIVTDRRPGGDTSPEAGPRIERSGASPLARRSGLSAVLVLCVRRNRISHPPTLDGIPALHASRLGRLSARASLRGAPGAQGPRPAVVTRSGGATGAQGPHPAFVTRSGGAPGAQDVRRGRTHTPLALAMSRHPRCRTPGIRCRARAARPASGRGRRAHGRPRSRARSPRRRGAGHPSLGRS